MLGTITSTLRSFYNPTQYEWAAEQGRGLELTYIFKLGLMLIAVLFAVLFYYASQLNVDLKSFLLAQDKKGNIQLWFALLANWPDIAVYAAMATAWAFGFMFSILNLAVVYAMYGQLFNLVFDARLGFAALVRVAVYALVAASVVTIAVLWLIKGMGWSGNTHLAIVGLIYTFYIFFGVMGARHG